MLSIVFPTQTPETVPFLVYLLVDLLIILSFALFPLPFTTAKLSSPLPPAAPKTGFNLPFPLQALFLAD